MKDFTKKQAWVFLFLWVISYIVIELVYSVLVSYVIQVAVEMGTVPTLINFQSFILYASLHTLEIIFYGLLLGIIQQQLFYRVLCIKVESWAIVTIFAWLIAGLFGTILDITNPIFLANQPFFTTFIVINIVSLMQSKLLEKRGCAYPYMWLLINIIGVTVAILLSVKFLFLGLVIRSIITGFGIFFLISMLNSIKASHGYK